MSTVTDKIIEMSEKYLDDVSQHQLIHSSESSAKKSLAIKKKLVQLESIRCQKMRSKEDLTTIDCKIAKLKEKFMAMTSENKSRR